MYQIPTDFATLMLAVKNRLAAFLFVFFITFTLGYLFLSAFGAVPNIRVSEADGATVSGEVATTPAAAAGAAPLAAEAFTDEKEEVVIQHILPLTMYIDKLDRTLPVHNPTSRAVADLDSALLNGIVRHPDSAHFGQEGTMFILGHSSYLPSVNNRFFKAFYGIQDLTWGDTITVTSADRQYVYQVDNVYKARAQEVSVPIATPGSRLTLATCNSFGTKDDRYIVEAKLLYSEDLPNA